MINDRTKEYYDLKKRNDVRESAKRLRRLYLRYKDAEIVYSLSHKRLLELAGEAGAIYRMEGTVLINRDILTHIWKGSTSQVPFLLRRRNNERQPLDGFGLAGRRRLDMMQRDFITYYQGADYYGLGLKVFTRLAHEPAQSTSWAEMFLFGGTILKSIFARRTADSFLKKKLLLHLPGSIW